MKKIISIILIMMFALSAVAEVPVLEILDENCEHDWVIEKYTESTEYSDGSIGGFLMIYNRCTKCNSTKKVDRTWFIFNEDDLLDTDFDFDDSDNGKIWYINGWYTVKLLEETEEPQPRFAINGNEAVTGKFKAKEFCNIEAWSKAKGITTDTVFTQAKYWNTDKYGNVTYELIADNDGIAMAHADKIKVLEGELPEITTDKIEESKEETKESTYELDGLYRKIDGYSACQHDESSWRWETVHNGADCTDANIQRPYCTECHNDNEYCGDYFVKLIISDNALWNHSEYPSRENGYGPHGDLVIDETGKYCEICYTYLHYHEFSSDEDPTCNTCNYTKGDEKIPHGYN